MEGFYKLYPEFNIFIYKKFNNNLLLNLSDKEIINHYSQLGNEQKLLSSIKEFYLKYPYFDLIFFKIINKNLLFENNIDYLVYYHNIENKEDFVYNVEVYLKKYNIDIIFLKLFYNEFNGKNDIDIIKKIDSNMNDYIISNNSFSKKFPDFNLQIYKKFNKDIILKNDIKYKSYWYNNHKNINNIIYSLNTIINKFPDFNSDLFKKLYIENNNINEKLLDNLILNDKNIVYSYDTFVKNIDDFNFDLFKKHNHYCKKMDKDEIIDFYLKNISKINYIYSIKFFSIKYPLFNILDFKFFNSKYQDDSNNIFNNFNTLKDKDSLIISTKDFYNKSKDFNINIYKSLLNIKYNVYFKSDDEYIYHWYSNNKDKYHDDYLNDFYNLYPDFDINIYKYFNKISNNNNINILFDFEKKN